MVLLRKVAAGLAKSRAAGAALLLLVAVVHFGYEPLAHWIYPDAHTQAAKAIFYVLRGLEGAVLWTVVFFKCERSLLVGIACAWGMAESAQTAVCRLALPIGGGAPVAPSFGGLCDFVSGLPVVGLTAVVVLVALSIAQEAEHVRKG